MRMIANSPQGLALQTLSWDKNWDSHSLVNGHPGFYPRIALVAPSPDVLNSTRLNLFEKQSMIVYMVVLCDYIESVELKRKYQIDG